MSPREFYYAFLSHNEREEERLTYQMKLQHVVARYQAALLLMPHMKTPIKDARELGRFSWEAPVVQSADQMKRLLLGIAKTQNKKYKKDGTKHTR